MFGNGNVIKNLLILVLVVMRMYSYSAFSNVLVLIHHQCTRTSTHETYSAPGLLDLVDSATLLGITIHNKLSRGIYK